MQAERANYYDAGITQTILPGWTVGVDGYYKTAKNQLDDGFFGQSLILSAFNYTEGRIHGVEFTTSYTTRFPEYISARSPIPAQWVYNVLRRFHAGDLRER